MDSAQTHISRGRSRPVHKTFRGLHPDQGLLLPPALDDWLPAEHPALFIVELVDEHLDFVPHSGRRHRVAGRAAL